MEQPEAAGAVLRGSGSGYSEGEGSVERGAWSVERRGGARNRACGRRTEQKGAQPSEYSECEKRLQGEGEK